MPRCLGASIPRCLLLANAISSNFFVDLTNKALQNFTWTAFSKMGAAIGDHGFYTLGPFNRTGQLINQILFNIFFVAHRFSHHVLINRAIRLIKCGSLNGF